jgi:hypothetical protein
MHSAEEVPIPPAIRQMEPVSARRGFSKRHIAEPIEVQRCPGNGQHPRG